MRVRGKVLTLLSYEAMRERILVVGRDAPLRETLVRLIALEGNEVSGGSSPEEAIARLETEIYSALFIELAMVEEQAEIFLSRVHHRWPDLAIILLIDQRENERAAEWLGRGAVDIVLKNRCRTDLPVVLRRAIQTAQLRNENRELKRVLEQESHLRSERFGARFRRLAGAQKLTLKSLLSALGAREEETRRHSERVADYALQISEQMDLDPKMRRQIFRGALLHDLGKIGIPDGILLKPGPLTEAEWAIMHSHPRLGHNILKDLSYLRQAAECALCHHERWDGSGYPLSLSEHDIPPTARIVAVADALDAMSVQRPYRGPLSFEDITNELVINRGTQFDPDVIDVALKLYKSWDDLHPEAIRRRNAAEKKTTGEPSLRGTANRKTREAA